MQNELLSIGKMAEINNLTVATLRFMMNSDCCTRGAKTRKADIVIMIWLKMRVWT